ncbi:uncharacterized protein JCM10292_002645 [Rhodotorula paludigena]|uniref:uncharacterized protein n=1 Tax=Rhodotorula paludigena TaxID=86838 RepID=UPI00316F9E4D
MASLSPAPRTPSTSPPPTAKPPSSCFYRARSLSELELQNLSLADMFHARHSHIADDDLDALPSLGQSVVEEAEERFQHKAAEALLFAATPAPSALPSPSRLRPPPAYSSSDAADPSYFELSRSALYSDGGESSYSTSSASTPSLWSAYSPDLASSSAEASSLGTPADSLVSSPLHPRSPCNGLALSPGSSGSPYSLARLAAPSPAKRAPAPPPPPFQLQSVPAPPPQQQQPAAPQRPSLASRRAHTSSSSLKLSLPPLRNTASFSALQGGGSSKAARPLKSPAANAVMSPLSAPSSPSRLSAPRQMEGTEKRLERRPSWIRGLEQKVEADGVRLRRRKSNGFAF